MLNLNKFFITNNRQIFRFIISGLIASSINFLVFNTTYIISGQIVVASSCGYLTGILASFLFARLWVFKDKSKFKVVKSLVIFCLIYFLGGIEMSTTIFLLNELIGNHKIAWLFGAFIGSLNNYLGAKYLLFKD